MSKIKFSKSSKLNELINSSYVGKIVDVKDDKSEGRCKIRVFGISDDSRISDSDIAPLLPYAYPILDSIFGTDGGSKFSTPKVNQIVRVVFDGDQYHPKYFSLENISTDLKQELSENYEGFNSIWFDLEIKLKFYYSKNSGLLMELDGSYINVLPDNSIKIYHNNGSSVIELRGNNITLYTEGDIDATSKNNVRVNSNLVHVNGSETQVGANPIYSSINGEPMMSLLKAMATIIGSKMPIDTSALDLVTKLEKLVLSNTVKVSP